MTVHTDSSIAHTSPEIVPMPTAKAHAKAIISRVAAMTAHMHPFEPNSTAHEK